MNRAIEVLVPVIAAAPVDTKTHERWLERLWEAIQDQGVPYIEALGEDWDRLCVTPEIANTWADRFLPLVEHIWSERAGGYFAGTSICLASLYAADRHAQLIALVDSAPFKGWHDRQWAVKALIAMGRKAEAIAYAEASRGLNSPDGLIAKACEEILLSSGLADEAYQRYAHEANRGTTYLATFRAIARKYPHKGQETILRDLIAQSPEAPGKWFAAAKDAGLFDLAIELANTSPTDPRTLTRAARDLRRSSQRSPWPLGWRRCTGFSRATATKSRELMCSMQAELPCAAPASLLSTSPRRPPQADSTITTTSEKNDRSSRIEFSLFFINCQSAPAALPFGGAAGVAWTCHSVGLTLTKCSTRS